jgi:hypothetical protein
LLLLACFIARALLSLSLSRRLSLARSLARTLARARARAAATLRPRQFCAGGDLHGWLRRAQLSGRRVAEPTAARWLTQMALALAHVHGRGIIHRDLKTQNVFLTEKARATASERRSAHAPMPTSCCACANARAHATPRRGDADATQGATRNATQTQRNATLTRRVHP